MTSTKELKARIVSARETQKITRAMHLIASTKLHSAKADLQHTRPYFDALRRETSRIFRAVEPEENPYLAAEASVPQGEWACLLITSDKGMAGAYNKNAAREAERLLARRPGGHLLAIGQHGVQYFHRLGVEPDQVFAYDAQRPVMGLARKIGSILVNGYETGRWNEIYVVYTEMVNSLQLEARSARLLPFSPADTSQPEEGEEPEFEFVPSVYQVLSNIVRSCVAGFVYGALISSYCSEQNARMTAMDTATQNAQRLLDELALQHNRLRQAIITQEITEISAGAKAQRATQGKEGTAL